MSTACVCSVSAASNTFAESWQSSYHCRGVRRTPFAAYLPLSADNTSAHYSSLRIRQIGRKEKMKNVSQCFRMLISRGLDHSHWFFCLSVCTACRVDHSGGKCLLCRWLLCGLGVHPQSGWYAFNRQFHLRMEVFAPWFPDIDSLKGAAETLTCYIMDKVPFFYSSSCCIENWENFSYCMAKTESCACKVLMSSEEISLFRWIVMARNPQCILGNTLLLNVSQAKKSTFGGRTNSGHKTKSDQRKNQASVAFNYCIYLCPWTLINCSLELLTVFLDSWIYR